jgi:hypothetical protein
MFDSETILLSMNAGPLPIERAATRNTMIKFIQCIRAKPGLSVEAFRERFSEYGERVRPLAAAAKAEKVSLREVLQIDQNLDVKAARGTEDPYDGVLELTWGRGTDVVSYLAQPAAKEAIETLRAYQEEFIDLSRSSFFFTSEDSELL